MSFTHNRNALFPVKGQIIDRIAQFCLPRALRARVPYARIDSFLMGTAFHNYKIPFIGKISVYKH